MLQTIKGIQSPFYQLFRLCYTTFLYKDTDTKIDNHYQNL